MASGHTITITPAKLRVEVSLDGRNLAESGRPVLLRETGLPTRYYLPRQDVRTDLLRRTDTVTRCPFKGQRVVLVRTGRGQPYEDVVWSYESPIPGAEGIAGLMCFYPERVELTVSGERQPSSQAAAR